MAQDEYPEISTQCGLPGQELKRDFEENIISSGPCKNRDRINIWNVEQEKVQTIR